MGILKVKLSDNYGYGPVNAADNYLSKNRTETFNLPKVVNWELIPNMNYSKGFGVRGLTGATATAPGGWIGFSVCFLLNQTSGIWPIADKTLNLQQGDGLITPRQMELTVDGVAITPNDSKMTNQVFLDSAKHMRSVLNKLNASDGSNAQFVYEWDLSSVPNLETGTLKNLTTGIQNLTVGQKIPVGAGTNTSWTQASGDQVPGWYGSNHVWEDGSATSFYSAFAMLERVENAEEVDDILNGNLDECFDNQNDQINELRASFDPEEEAEAKKKKK